MKTNTVEIRIDKDLVELLSPEALKAGVARRVARTKPGRRKMLTALLMAVTVLLSIGVMAFADTASPVPATPDASTEVVKLYIHTPPMGKWNITPDEQMAVMRTVAATAAGETPLAQEAVAQAIRQACEDTESDVATIISERRYSTNWDEEIPMSVQDAVLRITAGYTAVDANLGYCYNPAIQDGTWHETERTSVCTIGSLKFFE